MSHVLIAADGFFLPSGFARGGYLEIQDGVFGQWWCEKPTEDIEVLNYSGHWVAPGLVDTHIHGSAGDDVMDLSADALSRMCQALVKHGCTSWLPTTLTAPVEQLKEACKIVGQHVNAPQQTQVQGIFLEGPWFSVEKKGAQNPAYMTDPDIKAFDTWMEALDGRQMKIALAPERAGSASFCAYATKLGAVVALGHSIATYEQARACVDAGASIFVHTYNGMNPFHHRDVGMVGAAFTLDNVYAEVICDGHHLNPVAAHALMRARGYSSTILITDAMRAGSMPDGEYLLGELPVIVREGTARLTFNGSLAGSILTLDKAVQNVVKWGIASPQEAIAMATSIPAQACHIDNICGFIRPQKSADLAIFTPNLELVATYVSGELAWKA